MDNNSGYFSIKDEEWLTNQRIAGKILSDAFTEVKKYIQEGITTNQLNRIVEDYILDNKGIPTFKGYLGFPATSCMSVNKIIVHGIPNDIPLQFGDVLKVDAGVTIDGSIADAAFSIIIGENKKYQLLLDTCEKALSKAIDYIKTAKEPRLGHVGYIVEKEAKNIGANVIPDLTGHGLELNSPHFFPIIYNYGKANSGIRIIPGMTFCIEPIYVYGSSNIKVLDDNWSIQALDIGVHFEHTLFISKNNVEIITR